MTGRIGKYDFSKPLNVEPGPGRERATLVVNQTATATYSGLISAADLPEGTIAQRGQCEKTAAIALGIIGIALVTASGILDLISAKKQHTYSSETLEDLAIASGALDIIAVAVSGLGVVFGWTRA